MSYLGTLIAIKSSVSSRGITVVQGVEGMPRFQIFHLEQYQLPALALTNNQERKKMVTAKAVVAREPIQSGTPNWSLEEINVHDEPGEGEVLVEIHAAGICHTDLVFTTISEGTLGVGYPKITGHEGKHS